MDNRDQMELYKFSRWLKVWKWTNDVKNFIPYIDELKLHFFRFKSNYLETASQIIQSLYNSESHKVRKNNSVSVNDFRHRD